jgi:NodT family efflux transporter outer membrane factor (OMF) lipoprotein
MQAKQILMLSLMVSLSGCAIWGPNYKKPDVDVENSWTSKDDLAKLDQSTESADVTRLARMKWWEQFNDPVLNKLVIYTLANNPTIQQQIGSIIQAQGNLQSVQMAWLPTLAFSPGYRAAGTYTGVASKSAAAYTVGGNAGYFIDFVPSYSLNIMQQLRQVEAAKAGVGMAKYQKDAMRMTIIGQITGSYLSLRGYDYILTLQKKLVEDTAKQYELGLAQYKEGYISLLTLQTYQQQYDSAKSQVPVTQNNIVATRNAIRVLANKNPGDLARGLDFQKIPTDGIIPVNLPSAVLRARPDIRQMESGLIQANANIGVATSQFFPTISLTGNTGLASNGLDTLFNAGSDFWQVQAAALMPMLNLSIFGQIKSAKGIYYQAYWNYINTVRTAFSQVDNGLSGHDKLTKSYKAQIEAYKSTVTAYDLEDGRYKQGLDSLMPVLQYKIKMEQAALTLASSKTNQLQTIVTLYQALAAGYEVDNTDNPNTKFGDGRDI